MIKPQCHRAGLLLELTSYYHIVFLSVSVWLDQSRGVATCNLCCSKVSPQHSKKSRKSVMIPNWMGANMVALSTINCTVCNSPVWGYLGNSCNNLGVSIDTNQSSVPFRSKDSRCCSCKWTLTLVNMAIIKRSKVVFQSANFICGAYQFCQNVVCPVQTKSQIHSMLKIPWSPTDSRSNPLYTFRSAVLTYLFPTMHCGLCTYNVMYDVTCSKSTECWGSMLHFCYIYSGVQKTNWQKYLFSSNLFTCNTHNTFFRP